MTSKVSRTGWSATAAAFLLFVPLIQKMIRIFLACHFYVKFNYLQRDIKFSGYKNKHEHENMDDGVLIEVGKNCQWWDLLVMERVCRRWRFIFRLNLLWYPLYCSATKLPSVNLPPEIPDHTFRQWVFVNLSRLTSNFTFCDAFSQNFDEQFLNNFDKYFNTTSIESIFFMILGHLKINRIFSMVFPCVCRLSQLMPDIFRYDFTKYLNEKQLYDSIHMRDIHYRAIISLSIRRICELFVFHFSFLFFLLFLNKILFSTQNAFYVNNDLEIWKCVRFDSHLIFFTSIL